MKNVILNMTDNTTGQIVERKIDITNAMSNGRECWELPNEMAQRLNLECWIAERGNEQHATKLTLNSWVLA